MARSRSLVRRSHVRIAVEHLEDRYNPAPTFVAQTPQVFTQLNNNGFVTTGDWNDDGALDLVLTNYGNGTAGGAGKNIVFLYGDGTGKFGSPTALPVGGSSDAVSYLAVGDLNGDTFLDIVTCQTNMTTEDGFITIFKGSSVGAFEKVTGYPISSGGSRASWVGIADFTGDGKLDVAVVNLGEQAGGGATGRTIVTFKGDGNFGLTQFQKIDIPDADGVGICAAIADFGGDSKPDLAVGFASVPPDDVSPQLDGNIRVFINAGDGTLPTIAESALYGSGGPLPVNLVAGDFSGDGKADLVVANAGDPDVDMLYLQFGLGHSVGWLVNSGTGAFGPTQTQSVNFSSAFAVALSDVNIDGKLDLLVCDIGKPGSILGGNAVQGGLAVFFGKTTGVGFLADADSPYKSSVDAPQFLAVGSFNSNTDSTPDVVLVHEALVGTEKAIVTFLNQTVAATPTTTLLTTNPSSPATFGNNVTITATVSATTGTPTGTVTFFDGNTSLGTGTLATVGGSQQATFSFNGKNAGTYSLSARFEGSASHATSKSGASAFTINKASTTTTVNATPNPAIQGQTVTITATVSSAAGAPTGSVTFFEGATSLGSANLATVGGNQEAFITINNLPVGDHPIVAKYAGATNFAATDSASKTLTINSPTPVNTTTGLVSSLNPAILGQTVTFTATVTATAGTPTGNVTFLNGATSLGTVALSTVGGQQKASINVSSLGLGSHPITASYAGVTGFNPSTSSPAINQIINPSPTNTVLTVGPGSSPYLFGTPLTLTATITATSGTPTGTVAFFDNGVQIAGPIAVGTVGGQQQAQFVLTNPSLGSHPLTAVFTPGNGNFVTSTSTANTIQVNASPTTTTLQIGPGSSPYAFGTALTLTATIAATSGTPTGTVAFFDNGVQIAGPIAVGTVGGQQQAQHTVTLPTVGSHPYSAVFTPDTGFNGSNTGNTTITVNPVATTTAISSSLNPTFKGQLVTFTATVNPSVTVPVVPDGTVTFRIVGGADLGTVALATVGGVQKATLTTNALIVGDTKIEAVYGGNTTFTTSTSAFITQTVNQASTGLVGYREYSVGGDRGSTAAQLYNPNGTVRFTINPFPGFTGGVRTAAGDFNGDGIADIVVGTGPGIASNVIVLDGATQAQIFQVNPFEPTFLGGVYVASGDMTGDGLAELLISPDEGGGPRVMSFIGSTTSNNWVKKFDFFAIGDPDFRGGARAGVGDLNGDGLGDLVASAGFSGGPRIAGYNSATIGFDGGPKLFNDFFAFETELRNGAYVTAGDINGDGFADLVAGAGPDGGPRVLILSGQSLLTNQFAVLGNFFGGDLNSRGGARITVKELDGDNKADLVVGAGAKSGSRVTAYLGKNIAPTGTPPFFLDYDAFAGFTGGVFVG